MEKKKRNLIKEIASAIENAQARVVVLNEDAFDRVFKEESYSEGDAFVPLIEILSDRLNFAYSEFGEQISFAELDERALSSILKELKSGKFKVTESIRHRD